MADETVSQSRLPNRIRYHRKQQHISSDKLATMVEPPPGDPPVTGATIRRLETGRMGLTQAYLVKIATALNLSPRVLLNEEQLAGIGEEDAEEIDAPKPYRALATEGFKHFRVLSDVVEHIDGMAKGEPFILNTSQDKIDARRTGDILLVYIEDLTTGARVKNALRVFSAPYMLHSSRSRNKVIHGLNDTGILTVIKGVVVRE